MYRVRCRRIVTTASVELTSPSVDCGGAATPIAVMLPSVTHISIFLEKLLTTAATTTREMHTCDVLPGAVYSKLEVWANAQRDGRPAECRWRPLFNAAVWLTLTTRVPCSNTAKT